MAEHVCPVWIGYLLASPLRKLFQNPRTILSPYVSEGMKVLDIGCAMGFFSLPLAELVGPGGRVICVDVQEKMLASLEKRARKTGLSDNIETRTCPSISLDLEDLKEQIDFVAAIAVVHEVPNAANFFSEVHATLKPGGRLLMAEPKGHVMEAEFAITISKAEHAGFTIVETPRIGRSRAVLLRK
jgi:2-polyprenyl-3-methyl-5-hydroxy-6-metoxy-1,4-benzoquinol methylase